MKDFPESAALVKDRSRSRVEDHELAGNLWAFALAVLGGYADEEGHLRLDADVGGGGGGGGLGDHFSSSSAGPGSGAVLRRRQRQALLSRTAKAQQVGRRGEGAVQAGWADEGGEEGAGDRSYPRAVMQPLPPSAAAWVSPAFGKSGIDANDCGSDRAVGGCKGGPVAEAREQPSSAAEGSGKGSSSTAGKASSGKTYLVSFLGRKKQVEAAKAAAATAAAGVAQRSPRSAAAAAATSSGGSTAAAAAVDTAEPELQQPSDAQPADAAVRDAVGRPSRGPSPEPQLLGSVQQPSPLQEQPSATQSPSLGARILNSIRRRASQTKLIDPAAGSSATAGHGGHTRHSSRRSSTAAAAECKDSAGDGYGGGSEDDDELQLSGMGSRASATGTSLGLDLASRAPSSNWSGLARRQPSMLQPLAGLLAQRSVGSVLSTAAQRQALAAVAAADGGADGSEPEDGRDAAATAAAAMSAATAAAAFGSVSGPVDRSSRSRRGSTTSSYGPAAVAPPLTHVQQLPAPQIYSSGGSRTTSNTGHLHLTTAAHMLQLPRNLLRQPSVMTALSMALSGGLGMIGAGGSWGLAAPAPAPPDLGPFSPVGPASGGGGRSPGGRSPGGSGNGFVPMRSAAAPAAATAQAPGIAEVLAAAAGGSAASLASPNGRAGAAQLASPTSGVAHQQRLRQQQSRHRPRRASLWIDSLFEELEMDRKPAAVPPAPLGAEEAALLVRAARAPSPPPQRPPQSGGGGALKSWESLANELAVDMPSPFAAIQSPTASVPQPDSVVADGEGNAIGGEARRVSGSGGGASQDAPARNGAGNQRRTLQQRRTAGPLSPMGTGSGRPQQQASPRVGGGATGSGMGTGATVGQRSSFSIDEVWEHIKAAAAAAATTTVGLGAHGNGSSRAQLAAGPRGAARDATAGGGGGGATAANSSDALNSMLPSLYVEGLEIATDLQPAAAAANAAVAYGGAQPAPAALLRTTGSGYVPPGSLPAPLQPASPLSPLKHYTSSRPPPLEFRLSATGLSALAPPPAGAPVASPSGHSRGRVDAAGIAARYAFDMGGLLSPTPSSMQQHASQLQQRTSALPSPHGGAHHHRMDRPHLYPAQPSQQQGLISRRSIGSRITHRSSAGYSHPSGNRSGRTSSVGMQQAAQDQEADYRIGDGLSGDEAAEDGGWSDTSSSSDTSAGAVGVGQKGRRKQERRRQREVEALRRQLAAANTRALALQSQLSDFWADPGKVSAHGPSRLTTA